MIEWDRRQPYVTFHMLGHLGRLGNQLFQVAAVIGLARRNGWQYVLPPWKWAKDLEGEFALGADSDAVLEGPDGHGVEMHLERFFHHYDLPANRSINLIGWFQSEKYFSPCADEIRAMFTPRKPIRESAERKYGAFFKHPNTCSVHVRRKDYVGHPMFHQLDCETYYLPAMARLPSETRFLIFSDDVAWCRKHFSGRELCFVEGTSELEDLVLMSRCRNHIIGNSTFGWWGAWMNPSAEKVVLAPDKWWAGERADPSRPFAQMTFVHSGHLDTRDLMPERWVKCPS